MHQYCLLAGALVVGGVVTIIFGKVIGPRLLDLIAPSFNRVTNRLDDSLNGKPGKWEARVRQILEMPPEHLQQEMAEIVSRFAEVAPPCSKPCISLLPQAVQNFFVHHRCLSFDGQTKVLDASVLRRVVYRNRQYLLIGRSEDEEHFFAIDLQDKKSVVLVETDSNGKPFRVETDSPSFEHFVLLQHELATSGDEPVAEDHQ